MIEQSTNLAALKASVLIGLGIDAWKGHKAYLRIMKWVPSYLWLGISEPNTFNSS